MGYRVTIGLLTLILVCLSCFAHGDQGEDESVIQRLKPVPQEDCREIWLAGGCFWGVQKYMDGIFGVVDTDVGYANGLVPDPTYAQVCTGDTGYAETVRVVYDPQRCSLGFLLNLYFKAIDPTSVDRQGNDIGSQYRSGIYYLDPADLPEIQASIDSLTVQLEKPVAIEVEPLHNYYLAEDYHQRYLEKNPGGYCHITAGMCAAAHTARESQGYSKADEETLRSTLSDIQYRVTQQNATEPAFQNEYHDHFEPGIYVDITTGEPLFLSVDKFDSGCGWPAFAKPIDPSLIEERADNSYGMRRMEVRSKAGDAHLGHVFTDGPSELGGMRYCINSAALRFIPQEDMEREGYGELLSLLLDR